MRLKISARNTVELILPYFLPRKFGLRFVEQKKNWIQKHLQKKKIHIREKFQYGGISYIPELFRSTAPGDIIFREKKVWIGAKNKNEAQKCFQNFIKNKAKEILPLELKYLSKTTRVQFAKVTVRSQKSRWGSCNPKGNISLNSTLLQLDPEVREYVMIHELCHIKEMNHSAAFWELVEKYCPDFRIHRKKLRTYALTVF